MMVTALLMLKVVVIDTGLDINDQRFTNHLCEGEHKSFVSKDKALKDTYGHGTNMVGRIIDEAGSANYCLVIVRVEPDHGITSYLEALKYAVSIHPDIVNISMVGTDYDRTEYELIKSAPGTKFVVAAGNEGKNVLLEGAYPASLPLRNIIAVGNMNQHHKRHHTSNYGIVDMVWEFGVNITVPGLGGYYNTTTGTSVATATHTGKLIKEMSSAP
jgi:hypothetical protein